MGRTCDFEVCDEIATPSTGLSCAKIVTDASLIRRRHVFVGCSLCSHARAYKQTSNS